MTPREYLGRVMAVINPASSLTSVVSITLAGSLASTVLSGFHAHLLGTTFGAIDTIFTGTGLLIMAGGLYAMLNLRGVRLKGEGAMPAAAPEAAPAEAIEPANPSS